MPFLTHANLFKMFVEVEVEGELMHILVPACFDGCGTPLLPTPKPIKLPTTKVLAETKSKLLVVTYCCYDLEMLRCIKHTKEIQRRFKGKLAEWQIVYRTLFVSNI